MPKAAEEAEPWKLINAHNKAPFNLYVHLFQARKLPPAVRFGMCVFCGLKSALSAIMPPFHIRTAHT